MHNNHIFKTLIIFSYILYEIQNFNSGLDFADKVEHLFYKENFRKNQKFQILQTIWNIGA